MVSPKEESSQNTSTAQFSLNCARSVLVWLLHPMIDLRQYLRKAVVQAAELKPQASLLSLHSCVLFSSPLPKTLNLILTLCEVSMLARKVRKCQAYPDEET